MIELHASLSPNAIKINLMLEELGVPYRQHFVDVWKGDQFKEAFVALNPNGKVPVIVDPDGPDGTPYVVFESGAIMIYLAEKHGNRFLPAAGVARYEVLKWLMIQMTGVGPMGGQFVHFRRYATGENAYSVERYTSEVRRLYDLLDGRLAAAPYLGGNAYSVADIATFPWIRQLARIFADGPAFASVPETDFPNLRRWFDELAQRPAVEHVFAKVDATPSSMTTATDDDRDRFFQRGAYARQ